MEKRFLRSLIIASLPLVSLGQVQSLAGTPTITNLPPSSGSSYVVKALNPSGLLTGYFFPSNSQDAEAFLYANGNVVDLGNLGGASEGNAINSAGTVAGDSYLLDLSFHAFITTNGSLLDLGTLGSTNSTPIAINDAGQVAGDSLLADGSQRAFLYTNGPMFSVGDLGGNYSAAFALNASGMVAGESSLTNGDTHAILYSSGALNDLGTLGGTYSSARGINHSGLVVGEASLTNEDVHAFSYSGTMMSDLGTLGGTYSTASDVNSNGQVIGYSSLTGDQQYDAFVFSAGTMTDLGVLPGGNTSYPFAINNLGQIVGYSSVSDGSLHAVLWQNGQVTDLNTLVPTNSGWVLSYAQFINDAGRIVGSGTLNGVMQPFILDLPSSNSPPVANAGADQTVDCAAQATLDASLSSDPDNDPLTYAWTLAGNLVGTNVTLTLSLPLGTNVFTLTVTDTSGASSQTNVTVYVVDTTAPSVTPPAPVTASSDANCQAPVPNFLSQVLAIDNCAPRSQLVLNQNPAPGTLVGLGANQVIITATDPSGNVGSCTTSVTVVDTTAPSITSVPSAFTVSADANCQGAVPNVLPGVVASDNCTPANQLVMSQSPAAGTLLPHGQYTITVTVKDAAGNTSTAAVPLAIVDTTPPVIQSITASPNVLSPPSHQLVPVTVSVAAVDNCDPNPVSKITSITANGPTAPGDIQITGNLTATLAATKNSGSSRVYTLTVQCTDASGNSSMGTVTVTVPQGNGRK